MLIQFNSAESSVSLDAAALCESIPTIAESAIDAFYGVRDATIKWAYQEPFSTEHSLRSNLILLIFSAAESYFRRILAEVLTRCPIAAEAAAQQQIPLGAISTLGLSNLGFAISDTRGLTSSGEIIARTKNLLGITIQKTSSLGVAIEQFEKVCHFRHSIVHSSGELLYNNRRELSLKNSGRLYVQIDDKGIQDVVQVVVNAVRAYNNIIANEILQRWFVHNYFIGRWPQDKQSFCDLMKLFVSSRDGCISQSEFKLYDGVRKAMKPKTKRV